MRVDRGSGRCWISDGGMATAIDLFCGCGGLTLGLKAAGFRVLGAVDNDPVCLDTYRANHPEVRVWACDIRDLDASDLMEELGIRSGELDLLAGCPPCQGFSCMRTLNGGRKVHDPRNDLVLEFLRFVEGIRPKAVMMENVPGLADDERFEVFCNSMARLGYKGGYRILDAVDYGVPQRRRRLIYLAGLGGRVPFAEPVEGRRSVRNAIGGLPKAGESGDPLHDLPERRSAKVMALIRRIPKDGGSRTDLPWEEQLECHKRCKGFKDVYGRMAWDAPAPTITSGCFNPSKGRFLHPEEDRAITIREAALLQGFPMWYRFFGSKTAMARMIGNALPPPFVEAHARRVREFIESAGEERS